MKKNLQKLFSNLFIFIFLTIPTFASAQLAYRFESFIEPDSIEGLVIAILNFLIVIAIPIIVLFIIYSGFLYVTAQGNAEQTKKATTSLTYAIIGGVLVIGAVAIAEVIKNVVDAFKAN